MRHINEDLELVLFIAWPLVGDGEILLHLNVKQDTDSFALEKQNIQQTQINDHKTKMSRAKNDHIYLI